MMVICPFLAGIDVCLIWTRLTIMEIKLPCSIKNAFFKAFIEIKRQQTCQVFQRSDDHDIK